MSKLSAVTSNPLIKEFAQGIARSSIQPIADFLAPTVNVPKAVGRYKVYDAAARRFQIPNTLRAIGGEATRIAFTASDASYQCEPRALDYPVDYLEQYEGEGLEDALKEAMVAVSELASLDHEKRVVDLATGAVAATNKTWNSSADPIADIDAAIRQIMLNINYGSLMDIGVLFGVDAWLIFKNHVNVRKDLPIGRKRDNLQVVDQSAARAMLLGEPETRVSFMAYNSAKEGKTPSPSFVMGSDVFVFARKAQPTRRDPSFMKTFRLQNRYLVPGSYEREDGRGEVAKFDWSEDPRVTNSAAAVRLHVSTT